MTNRQLNTKTTGLRAIFARFGKVPLRVGDRLKNGTICIAVDNQKSNEALVVPKRIFAGISTFDEQDKVVAKAKEQVLHGQKDWRALKDPEATVLSRVWNAVAPRKWCGLNAMYFWLRSSYGDKNPYADNHPYGRNQSFAKVHRGGYEPSIEDRKTELPVPVVRSVSDEISITELAWTSRIKAVLRHRKVELKF